MARPVVARSAPAIVAHSIGCVHWQQQQRRAAPANRRGERRTLTSTEQANVVLLSGSNTEAGEETRWARAARARMQVWLTKQLQAGLNAQRSNGVKNKKLLTFEGLCPPLPPSPPHHLPPPQPPKLPPPPLHERICMSPLPMDTLFKRWEFLNFSPPMRSNPGTPPILHVTLQSAPKTGAGTGPPCIVLARPTARVLICICNTIPMCRSWVNSLVLST